MMEEVPYQEISGVVRGLPSLTGSTGPRANLLNVLLIRVRLGNFYQRPTVPV